MGRSISLALADGVRSGPTETPYSPNEMEDVATEALEELVEKARAVKSVEELKPLAASIAHHRAVSLKAAKSFTAEQTKR